MGCILGQPPVHTMLWVTFSNAGVIGRMKMRQTCSCLNMSSWPIPILSLEVTKGCWTFLTWRTRFSIHTETPPCRVLATADSLGSVANPWNEKAIIIHDISILESLDFCSVFPTLCGILFGHVSTWPYWDWWPRHSKWSGFTPIFGTM